jgi:ABC-type polysaccharide/polyol phosphate export permease
LYKLNPAVLFVESYRNLLLNNTGISLSRCVVLFFIGVLSFIIGHMFFNHYNKRFAEEI